MIDRHATRLASWLSRPAGFLATCFTGSAGIAVGFTLSFNDHWALVFNLALSIGALLFAAIILVAGAKDTAAIQAKVDELIRAVDKADDRPIGIDRRSAEELEQSRGMRADVARSSVRPVCSSPRLCPSSSPGLERRWSGRDAPGRHGERVRDGLAEVIVGLKCAPAKIKKIDPFCFA